MKSVSTQVDDGLVFPSKSKSLISPAKNWRDKKMLNIKIDHHDLLEEKDKEIAALKEKIMLMELEIEEIKIVDDDDEIDDFALDIQKV